MNVIIDYGLGNIRSLENWFRKGDLSVVVSNNPACIESADLLILPGVGAYEDAMKALTNSGMDQMIYDHVKAGKPMIGICLGMQLLFERSYEKGVFDGLGLLAGEIVPFDVSLKVPHMGWNDLSGDDFYKGQHVYFVHSYYLKGQVEDVVAYTEYGVRVPAVVQKGNIMGFQFHPEKSGTFGYQILEKIKEFKDEVLSGN